MQDEGLIRQVTHKVEAPNAHPHACGKVWLHLHPFLLTHNQPLEQLSEKEEEGMGREEREQVRVNRVEERREKKGGERQGGRVGVEEAGVVREGGG